jgi:hypothetical protein
MVAVKRHLLDELQNRVRPIAGPQGAPVLTEDVLIARARNALEHGSSCPRALERGILVLVGPNAEAKTQRGQKEGSRSPKHHRTCEASLASWVAHGKSPGVSDLF